MEWEVFNDSKRRGNDIYQSIRKYFGGEVMKQIRTSRVLIIPCSISLAKSLILYPNDFKKVSPVSVPESFPSYRIKGILPLLLELYELDGGAGWYICFIIDLQNQLFIGELEIDEKISKGQSVIFSLHFTDDASEKEFASEVIEGLIVYYQKIGAFQVIRTEVPANRPYLKEQLKRYEFEEEENDGNYSLMKKYIK